MPLSSAPLIICFLLVYMTSVWGQFSSFPFKIVDNSFLKFPNATNVTQTSKQVATKINCIEDCVEILWCLSINFKKSAEESGLHLCEFFSADVFNNEQHLQENEGYIHYSVKVNRKRVCLNISWSIQHVFFNTSGIPAYP